MQLTQQGKDDKWTTPKEAKPLIHRRMKTEQQMMKVPNNTSRNDNFELKWVFIL